MLKFNKKRMLQYFFQCPYCWEEISMILEESASAQNYIEDCEVCCNPIEIDFKFNEGQLDFFEAKSIEQ